MVRLFALTAEGVGTSTARTASTLAVRAALSGSVTPFLPACAVGCPPPKRHISSNSKVRSTFPPVTQFIPQEILDAMESYDSLPGFFLYENFLTERDRANLQGSMSDHRKLIDAQTIATDTKVEHHPKTGESSYALSYRGIDTSEEERILKPKVFKMQRTGKQISHEGIVYQSRVPNFVNLFVQKLDITYSVPKMVFWNRYARADDSKSDIDLDAEKIAFGAHTDLYTFTDEMTIAYTLYGSADLWLAPVKKPQDGYHEASNILAKQSQKISLSPNTLFVLTGEARHNYAHWLTTNGASERESLAIGFRVTTSK